MVSAGLGAPNNVVLVPVVPPPNSEGVVISPPVEGAGFVDFPKTLLSPPNALGTSGFTLNKLHGVIPGAGVVVVVMGVGAMEMAPKSESAGFEPKVFPDFVTHTSLKDLETPRTMTHHREPLSHQHIWYIPGLPP